MGLKFSYEGKTKSGRKIYLINDYCVPPEMWEEFVESIIDGSYQQDRRKVLDGLSEKYTRAEYVEFSNLLSSSEGEKEEARLLKKYKLKKDIL